jgi:hypothetical protein
MTDASDRDGAAPDTAQGVLPVLYRRIEPLNRELHRGLRLKALEQPLAFVRDVHVLPALAEEFPKAATFFAILFARQQDGVTPVFALALKPGANRYVSADGRWDAGYLPAYLRRYPFILAEVEGRDPLLCFDVAFPGFNEAEGQPLFDETGEPSSMLREAMTFAGQFRESARRTGALVGTLQRLELLRPVTLDVQPVHGDKTRLEGVMVVDEAKLRDLPDAEALALFRSGELAAIHAHLMSLGHLARLG